MDSFLTLTRPPPADSSTGTSALPSFRGNLTLSSFAPRPAEEDTVAAASTQRVLATGGGVGPDEEFEPIDEAG
jgi:hypothetical protein